MILLLLIMVGFVQLSSAQNSITEKTLVVWVSPDNGSQQGGSCLTVEDGLGNFDGIVFGEISPKRWMAGSTNFARTQKDQSGYPEEEQFQKQVIRMAIVYEADSIRIFRNDTMISAYQVVGIQSYPSDQMRVLFGRRHLDAADPLNTFEGVIREARVYDFALTANQIRKLEAGAYSPDQQPWAHWDFVHAGLQDVTRKFTHFELLNGAFCSDSGLVLSGHGASLVATMNPAGNNWADGYPVPKNVIRDTRLFRERLLSDPYRPAYHFCIPDGNGMPGDPNGAFFANGRYHLMYLYNREESGFCWGHISSTDLLHWRHHPDAIGPGDGDEGCFSGGAFVDTDGSAYLTYWMLWGARGIGMARSLDPSFNRWRKFESNPVIRSSEWGVTEMTDDHGEKYFIGSADPSNIWKQDRRYYMLAGNLLVLNKLGRQPDSPPGEQGDRLYLFESEDLVNWNYVHRFYESHRKWTDASEDNMCPSFFPLPLSPDGGPMSDQHLLLFISHNKGCQYYIGNYEDHHFYPEKHGRMTWVDNEYFAPEALMDDQGRQIMWSWIFDGRPDELKSHYGWTGTYGLPRTLWLNDDGELGIRPVREIEMLRRDPKSIEKLSLPNGEERVMNLLSRDLMELELELDPGDMAAFELSVCVSPDLREKTVIAWDRKAETLSIDTRQSGLDYGKKVTEAAPFHLKEGEPLRLRVFVDRSIVEVFANDRQAIARRIYPTLGGNGIRLKAVGGAGELRFIKSWEIAPANSY